MLTTELRTMDMKEVIELWETDKKKLKIKLLDDYHMLVKEYRKQCKVYTQESSQGSKIFNKYKTFERINYQAELGIDKNLYGTVKFTEDFTENLKISLEVLSGKHHDMLSLVSYELKETIRLKAREIEDTLKLLKVKISYDKDFSKYHDQWLHEDLEELRIQEIQEREKAEQDLKERKEYIIEEI